jgi:hypothetical protein
MAFSPFGSDIGLLASSGEDSMVKLWRIPASGLPDSGMTESWACLPQFSRRVDQIQFHPTAAALLTTASCAELAIWDVEQQSVSRGGTALISINTADAAVPVQGFSWKESGQLVATTSKDGMLRIWDPRRCKQQQQQQQQQQNDRSQCSISGQAHAANSKSCRVVWLGDGDYVFTTGFSQVWLIMHSLFTILSLQQMRQQEYAMFDCRGDLSKPVLRTQLDSASNVLMPLYDSDAALLYLVSRGSNTVRWMELKDGQVRSKGSPTALQQSVSGATLLPKTLLAVMEAEINRLLVINGDSITPGMLKLSKFI